MLLDKKAMRCYYQQYEKKSVRDLHSRAEAATWMSFGKVPLLEMPQQTMELLQNLLCYLLFGTIISAVSPWLLLLLTAAPAANWFCVRHITATNTARGPNARTSSERPIM